MFEYKNTKTGATFSSPCVISGGDWVILDGKLAKEAQPVASTLQTTAPLPLSEEPQEDTEAFDGITVKQIKQELEAFGVDYNPRSPKQDLYDLMMAQGK